MELTQNQVPDILSIRAEMLTRSITKLNSELVKVCCALQLIETQDAYFTVKVLKKDDFLEIFDFPVYWYDEKIDLAVLAQKMLLQIHAGLTAERSKHDRELSAIRHQLAAIGRISTNSETSGDL